MLEEKKEAKTETNIASAHPSPLMSVVATA